ncbi:MAG: NAD(P)/FAD-dependent oxidoreductase [Thermoanaerobaculia bacterium]|nr:NAD(P)/FAD-dependent oxidoreductase [Thermoanaerobaculia bacterium]
MARTPLFRLLRRSARLARVSLATGWDAGETVERAAAARLSRRELLAGTGALLGLAACGPLGKLGGRSSDRPILIVGAGIAGLTCAWRLHQKGVPVRVIEGQDRVGGRMYSLAGHFPEGQVCELGGELVDSGHKHLRRLARQLHIPMDDLDETDPAIAADTWFFDGRRLSEAEIVAAFRPLAAKMAAAWEEVEGDGFDYRNPNGAERIDRLSIAAWLDEAGLDEKGGFLRKLLDVGYVTEYGLEIDQQSAWNLLYLIDYEQPDPFRIFGESDERYHIRGGNDLVPKALGEKLGSRVETGVALEALRRGADGSYLAEVRRGGTSETITADRVVVALPFTKLREVALDVELPAAKRKAIDELGYGTNAKLMVGFSERIWRTSGRSSGSVLTDLPFQLAWEASRKQAGTAGILVAYSGGAHGLKVGQGTPAEQSAAFIGDLDRVFPGVAAKKTTEVRFHWPTFPWMKGSYACYRPGQWTTIAGAEGEAVAGLHFCGEHTSIEAQGFMEGGCESGERVAAEILAG